MSSELTRRLFTVEECYRMAEVGILRSDERVELIRGELIVKMSPIGPRHGAAVDGATRAFVRLAGDSAIVRVQEQSFWINSSHPSRMWFCCDPVTISMSGRIQAAMTSS
jgi:hypothetical protein